MVSDRYLRMRERLFEQLSLSDPEKVFVQRHHKSDLTVRRVALLIADYLDTVDRSKREGLLRLLLDEAVPALRAVMMAQAMELPGHRMVSEQLLRALQGLAVQGIRACRLQGQARHNAVTELVAAGDVVMHLDPEVAAVVEPQSVREVRHG